MNAETHRQLQHAGKCRALIQLNQQRTNRKKPGEHGTGKAIDSETHEVITGEQAQEDKMQGISE